MYKLLKTLDHSTFTFHWYQTFKPARRQVRQWFTAQSKIGGSSDSFEKKFLKKKILNGQVCASNYRKQQTTQARVLNHQRIGFQPLATTCKATWNQRDLGIIPPRELSICETKKKTDETKSQSNIRDAKEKNSTHIPTIGIIYNSKNCNHNTSTRDITSESGQGKGKQKKG